MYFTSAIIYIIYIVSVLNIFINLVHSCHGIENVFATIKDDTGKWSNATLTGCIERTSFDEIKVTEIHIKNQRIPKLDRNCVRNLIKLDILEFKNCEIENIVPGTFRNLPDLRIVGITHNPKLTIIKGGIFDIFETIHILRLDNNNIRTITDEALSNMTLQEVNFSYNNFSTFDPVWFAYSPYIKHLYFQNNYIENIPKRAFDTMKQLQNINFENNRITQIGIEAFRKLNHLRTLNLRNNKLNVINSNIFPNNLQVDFLNLAANYLLHIPKDVLNRLALNEICIDYNPFLCSCYNILIDYFNRNEIILKRADDCNLRNIPFCINTATECSESNLYDLSKVKRIMNIYTNLSPADKKCTGLENYP